MKTLKYFFLVVDLGFIMYWIITFFELIPVEYLYNDYSNPILVDWNWSFFPLDILISITGLSSVSMYYAHKRQWRIWALISLILTFTSGLQAISYWAFAHEFDITWWSMNGFLLIYPLFFIPALIKQETEQREAG